MILASASKIRSQILLNAGIKHKCISANIDESKIKRELKKTSASVEFIAIALSKAKALAVIEKLGPLNKNHTIISADQILECDGKWFKKPKDLNAARKTLLSLRGKTHYLVSAVTVFHKGKCIWSFSETPRLKMRNFTDNFLENYLKSSNSDIFKSVGAYNLENTGIQLFSRIEGDYFTMLGLPLMPLLILLRKKKMLVK